MAVSGKPETQMRDGISHHLPIEPFVIYKTEQASLPVLFLYLS